MAIVEIEEAIEKLLKKEEAVNDNNYKQNGTKNLLENI
jgi:hypothetical protein